MDLVLMHLLRYCTEDDLRSLRATCKAVYAAYVSSTHVLHPLGTPALRGLGLGLPRVTPTMVFGAPVKFLASPVGLMTSHAIVKRAAVLRLGEASASLEGIKEAAEDADEVLEMKVFEYEDCLSDVGCFERKVANLEARLAQRKRDLEAARVKALAAKSEMEGASAQHAILRGMWGVSAHAEAAIHAAKQRATERLAAIGAHVRTWPFMRRWKAYRVQAQRLRAKAKAEAEKMALARAAYKEKKRARIEARLKDGSTMFLSAAPPGLRKRRRT